MKSLLLVLAIAVSLIITGCSKDHAQSIPLVDKTGSKISHSYIVVLKQDSNAETFAQEHITKVRKVYKRALKGLNMSLSEGEAAVLVKDSRVKYIEPDQTVSVAQTQANPPWGLDRIDQRNLPLDASFSYQRNGTGVTIYIVDTGIYFGHNEFGGRASLAWDAILDGRNGEDCHGHGTHVAGIAAGSTYGIAKNAQLKALRVLDCAGNGQISDILAAIDYITINGARPSVANISINYPGSSPSVDEALIESIGAGYNYTFSAGNTANDACFYGPGNTGHALNIGASWSEDERVPFSNYGTCVDMFAPGFDILSANIGAPDASIYRNGTSMSAPHVAGAVALYLQSVPYANMSMIKSALINNSTQDVLFNVGTGSPNRLLFLTYGTGVEPTPSPTPCPVRTRGKKCR
jgi:subtilisin family serine protease